VEDRTAVLYPSPAGAVEASLSEDDWAEILQANPILSELQPDIEALLINRAGDTRASVHAEYYIAPIDECYRLAGLIRASWRGFSGGPEVWDELGRFFTDLKSRAEVVRGDVNE
jgi:hypothetical protein